MNRWVKQNHTKQLNSFVGRSKFDELHATNFMILMQEIS